MAGAIAHYKGKYESEQDDRKYFQSLHDSNISYASDKEFKKAIDSFNLPISSRHIDEVNHITTRTESIVKTTIYDTLINGNRYHYTKWNNGYSSIDGVFEQGARLTHRDTLDIILAWHNTKRFLGIFGYARKDSLQIYNKDPDSKILIHSFRRLKKK